MRSKKLEPGLSVSPAGMEESVAVAGVVRAEEGGAAVGEAQIEEEARVEVRAVEARAAVRVVTASEGGRGRQCHLPGWGCPALGPAADPSCRRGCRRGYRHFRSRARRSPRYRPRSRPLPCWPRRRRTCRCVPVPMSSLMPMCRALRGWLAWFHPTYVNYTSGGGRMVRKVYYPSA